MVSRPIFLASASPRRKLLLEEAGIAVQLQAPAIDDGLLDSHGVRGEHWVMAMAWLKGRSAADEMLSRGGVRGGTILAADTVCLHRGRILGQPADADHARQMLELMRDDEHVTVTGFCLINLISGERRLSVDRTIVRIGHVSDEQIGRYVQSGQWRGKAGAYNLSERIADGWPIQVVGDPTTVMGLPMQRLRQWLQAGAGE